MCVEGAPSEGPQLGLMPLGLQALPKSQHRAFYVKLMLNGSGSGWSAIREVATRAEWEDEVPDAQVR
jgi:hypothetical protein